MAVKECRDSLPPLRMAALPDLIARAVMLAMTSGRASKMTSRTPTGQVSRYSSRLSSSFRARVTFPTGSSREATSRIPCSMESYLSPVDRSSRLMREGDRLADLAASRSLTLAAMTSSLASRRASWTILRVAVRSSLDTVFSTVAARWAFCAISIFLYDPNMW